MGMSREDIELKVAVVGGSLVGKTSLLYRFVLEEFPRNPSVTLGASMLDKKTTIRHGNLPVKFGVWDTAGDHATKPHLLSVYARGSSIVVVVFDITRRETFTVAQNLLLQLREGPSKISGVVLGVPVEPVFMLVGNKLDLAEPPHGLRQVPFDEAAQFAEQRHLRYMEVSSKTGIGINAIFREAAEEAVEKFHVNSPPLEEPLHPDDETHPLHPTAFRPEPSRCCCLL